VSQKHIVVNEAQKNAGSFILGGMIPFLGRFRGKEKDLKKRFVGGDVEPPSSNGDEQEGRGRTEDVRFELRDINIVFPEGKLSVITGPTASGKTALLVRSWLEYRRYETDFHLLARSPRRNDTSAILL
jgi:hypothetical protein